MKLPSMRLTILVLSYPIPIPSGESFRRAGDAQTDQFEHLFSKVPIHQPHSAASEVQLRQVNRDLRNKRDQIVRAVIC
jgi:hypothetical protein